MLLCLNVCLNDMLVEFKSGSGPLKNMDQVKAWKTLFIFNHQACSFDIWYVTKIVQIMPLGELISQVSTLGPSWPSCLSYILSFSHKHVLFCARILTIKMSTQRFSNLMSSLEWNRHVSEFKVYLLSSALTICQFLLVLFSTLFIYYNY